MKNKRLSGFGDSPIFKKETNATFYLKTSYFYILFIKIVNFFA